jgi:flagellar hook-associated protein 3 FlgL
MSRVTENSSQNTINYAVGKVKGKVEDLQLKGSTLKRLMKPSDDPIGNVELLTIRSQNIDSAQYMRNAGFAQTQLSYTENVLEGISEILNKAKELAIGQASSIYSPEVRQGVAKEIHQLRQQLLSMANKRVGNRYIFAGQKVLTRPFDRDGKFMGDTNRINVEINKDLYLPINIHGKELFFSTEKKQVEKSDVDLKAPEIGISPEIDAMRKPASIQEEVPLSMFDELRSLENALITDNPQIIQNLLEKLDDSLERVVAVRTRIGALMNTITNSDANIEKDKLANETQKSKIEDADVAELFGELHKEQNILKATYKASSNLMNTSLMDFIK